MLFDPNGLDHSEMLRLATARIMSNNADLTKFSDKAFFVSVDAKDVTLPDGTIVASGIDFRNNFHFNSLARGDFFVPCGGRPAAVNSDNVLAFLYGQGSDPTGTPRFRYVVEGANLFFTPQARLILEKHGLIVFKVAECMLEAFGIVFTFLIGTGRKREQRWRDLLESGGAGCTGAY